MFIKNASAAAARSATGARTGQAERHGDHHRQEGAQSAICTVSHIWGDIEPPVPKIGTGELAAELAHVLGIGETAGSDGPCPPDRKLNTRRRIRRPIARGRSSAAFSGLTGGGARRRPPAPPDPALACGSRSQRRRRATDGSFGPYAPRPRARAFWPAWILVWSPFRAASARASESIIARTGSR